MTAKVIKTASDERPEWGHPLWSDIRGQKLAEPKAMTAWEAARTQIKIIPPGQHWYAVHCTGAPEATVINCMRNVHWDVYQPSCLELRAVPKRKLTASQRNSPFTIKRPTPVPLFPRYPFVRFDLRDGNRHEMFKLLGVQGMICDGSNAAPQPAYIADDVIEKLKQGEVEGSIRSGTTLRELAYTIGEQVRISSGPFAGHNATVDELPSVPIEQLDENARLSLLLSFFGRQTVIELTLVDIEKL